MASWASGSFRPRSTTPTSRWALPVPARSPRERSETLEVTVTCASAGRMDHALAVFGVLASNADLAPYACRGRLHLPHPLAARHPDVGAGGAGLGCHFSFVALADASVVSERGMRWELDHFRVDALRDRGISNVIDADDAAITCHVGIVAAFVHPLGPCLTIALAPYEQLLERGHIRVVPLFSRAASVVPRATRSTASRAACEPGRAHLVLASRRSCPVNGGAATKKEPPKPATP